MSNFDEILTPDEVAEILKISPKQLAQWRYLGKHKDLLYFYCGRKVRYKSSDLKAFIEKNYMEVNHGN